MVKKVSLGLLFALIVASTTFAQNVRYVDDDAPQNGNGLTWETAYVDLQDALADASNPKNNITEIWVAEGVYVPSQTNDTTVSFQLYSDVAIYGGFIGNEDDIDLRDPQLNETILSGDLNADDVYGDPVWYSGWDINTPNSDHVVNTSGTNTSAILDGVAITAGYVTSGGGAGVYNNGGSPTIRNCVFSRNLSGFSSGAAFLNLSGSPTFENCAFIENYVHLGSGAGIYSLGFGVVSITDSLFSDNIAVGASSGGEAAGAAISNYLDSTMTITRCEFIRNTAKSFYAKGDNSGTYAGALHHLGISLEVVNCIFDDNYSNAGGAIFCWRSASIINSLFINNEAPEYHTSFDGWGGVGGAIAAGSSIAFTVDIVGCTIVNNSARKGGGVRMLNQANANVSGCILWANSDINGNIGPSQIKGTGASYCCIQNMLIGEPDEDPPDPENFPNCIDENPLFVDLVGEDFHLIAGSPCIDAADNTAFPEWVNVDFDGLPRFVDDPDSADTGNPGNGSSSIADMGMYEFQLDAVVGDLDGDGSIGTSDLLILLSNWGPCADCNDCIADIDNDCAVGVSDLLILLANWG